MERGDDPGRDREPAPAEKARGERGEKRRAERTDGRRRDFRSRDRVGTPEGRDGEEGGVAGRPKEENVGTRGVASLPDERLRGVQIGAGVSESDRREAGDRDDGEPRRQREKE